ncbi:tetratricopeptide repeat protein [Actinosynnema sp. NPDC047251]|uniref:Uncharacterized protein n=1 Tax=Saccharothrix espanaensis (strain ATCC 51144 / DSM 44229 / JCM 9112 / NBRC 15066 / NRRL 15764) TaxID=1179773 RepID=K0K3J5_SACES|nr:tetratricopeptide repeat protein [Saccharothrix espanaensis]CCH32132.1 hypothetical protein BN6_48600 [Saccharothrix espanaensis DSM 44229]
MEVVIEKDRQEAGPIHHTMFKEALQAPVYIADLTGANPNVYLELGVRWALRDNVTILVCQDPADVRFNVAPNRVVYYTGDMDEVATARDSIVTMIINGLTRKHVDSPVRHGYDLVTVTRAHLKVLDDKVAELEHSRGDDLLATAMDDQTPYPDRVRLLRQALDLNEARADVNGALGIELRDVAEDLVPAINHLDRATRLQPEAPKWWRELGIAQSRKGQLEAAVRSLSEAVRLDPADAGAHSSLGGAQRRPARATGDVAELRRARDSYRRAGEVKPDETYSLANLARLDVVPADDDAQRAAAVGAFRRLNPLATWLTEGKQATWPWLDRADILAFHGDTAAALDALRTGMGQFEPEKRPENARTAAEPLRDMVATGWLDDSIAGALRALIGEYEKYA